MEVERDVEVLRTEVGGLEEAADEEEEAVAREVVAGVRVVRLGVVDRGAKDEEATCDPVMEGADEVVMTMVLACED